MVIEKHLRNKENHFFFFSILMVLGLDGLPWLLRKTLEECLGSGLELGLDLVIKAFFFSLEQWTRPGSVDSISITLGGILGRNAQ